MGGVFNFGVRAEKVDDVNVPMWSYYSIDGAPLAAYQYGYTVPGHGTGDWTWVGALATDGFYVSRVEWWDGGPFTGTLIEADDMSYASEAAMIAAGWEMWRDGVDSFTGNEIKILGGGFSDGVRKLTPAGANTCILRGCHFESEGTTFWGMVSLHHGNGPSDNGGDYGEGGIRVLCRKTHPHLPEGDFYSYAEIPPELSSFVPPLRQRQRAA